MLFESAHVRVTSEYGTATLWLGFPGEPVNALDVARLRELDAALAVVERSPFVRGLVVRSAKPAGFCAGVHPAALASLSADADRAAFSAFGQRVFDRLAALDAVTVAVIDGPCLGAGLELALACDHRLCVSRPTTHLGFPDAPNGILPGFGGTVRLRRQIGRASADQLIGSGRTLSGREARGLGLVDHAFCERRAKIEVRTLLDQLENSRRWAAGPAPAAVAECGLTAERRAFVQAIGTVAARTTVAAQIDALRPLTVSPAPVNPVPPFPAVVGVVGDAADAARIGSAVVLRGGVVVVRGSASRVFAGIAAALGRGFITPLEADQAKARVTASESFEGFGRAGLVVVADGASWDGLADAVSPRCLVALPAGAEPAAFSRLRRVVEVRFTASAAELVRGPETDSDTTAALAAWLKTLGFTPSPTPAVGAPARLAA